MAARSKVRRRVYLADGRTAVLKLVFVLALVIALPGGAWPQSKFVNETADGSANDAGFYSSLALDAQGNPHVSYRDAAIDTRDLKYARKSGGVWTIETVNGAGDRGFHSSIALDASGNPHVSYLNFFGGALEYARKSGGVWTTETADGSGSYAEYTSLALDAQGNPHVSYRNATTGRLKYARKSGGVWTIETADGSASDGGFTSLALDAQGNPHVSYYDLTFGILKYARKSGGVWTNEVADGSAFAGLYSSLALDAQGNPQVSYLVATSYDLKYARKSGGVWTTEYVDGVANDLGHFTSLALDAQGNPHVSYFNDTTDDLKYASKSGGVWTTETADGSGNSVGWYTSLALDAQGNPHVSYYDATTGDLKYADAAVHVLSPAGGVTWAVGSLQNVRWAGVGPVVLSLSLDGGRTFDVLRTGLVDNVLALRVPHVPTRFARLRVERASPLSTAESDSFFAINATIALFKFDAAAGADGKTVALSWQTAPGPEAEVRYKVERAPVESGMFAPIHAGLLDGEQYVDLDLDRGAASRYRLTAVNGLGEEYILGEAAVTSPLAEGHILAVAPNPAPSGKTRVLFKVPADLLRADIAIYDASGQRVRTLLSESQAAGTGVLDWDGTDARGRPVAAGVYFIRLSSMGGFAVTERVTVLR